MQNRFLLLILFAWLSPGVNGQTDPILFSVDDIGIPVSEFDYIYTKNNRDNADYSRESVAEYLDLYTRFKLKVKRARDLQLDTVKALQTELAGYRSQLAKSYLNDKEVVDRLTREAWERMQWDLKVAHILIRTNPGASPEDIQRAKDQATQVAAKAKGGEDFAKLAQAYSDDKASAANGGELGFLTCMLPGGFYEVENAIYDLKEGEISEPVRSSLGFHILKVLERRPARGEIEAAHIFVRVKTDSSNEAAARQKISAVHQNLQDGKSFEDLAMTVSDDPQTSRRGGYIGRFGINSYDPEFEEAAYGLETPGSFSEPIRTRAGWHIIKLVERHQLGSFDEEKNRLEARISRDDRVAIATRAMIDKIRKEAGIAEDTTTLNLFIESLGEDFLTFQWEYVGRPSTLITFNDGTIKTTADFGAFLKSKTRERMRSAKTATPQSVARALYTEWLNEVTLSYEEARLEEKYPEFHALMREYEEGILLFEVTKMMVWDKASQDTAGLRKYFSMHRESYMWPERAEVANITTTGKKAVKVAEKARKLLATYSIDETAAKLNKKSDQLIFQRKKYLRDELTATGLEWARGSSTETVSDPETGDQSFSIVTALLPPEPKALNEARGYVIADYQDFLEKEWVDRLREMYPVHVNQPVLNSLIKN